MRSALREMRRAPLRVAASTLAIALAIAAMGIFAIPSMASNTLRDIAAADLAAHLQLTTTPFDATTLRAEIEQMDGVEAVELGTTGTVTFGSGGTGGEGVRVESYPESSSVNRIRLGEGRMPRDAGEVLVSPGVAPLGSVLRTPGGDPGDLTVVGLGQSTLSAADEVVFARPDTAALLTGIEGSNTISLRLADPTAENLETTLASVRAVLGSRSVALTSLPVSLPDGAHPIEEGITEVSFMIGSLGVVAGIVALVLLASTASAMVTERTRDAAIMRAIGARRRVARRELRRPAVFVGLLGTAIGLPLGVLVANVVAEMVLERFAGLNPPFSLDPVVLAASAVFGVLGARIVSARSARRVARVELTTALRDREPISFGNRWSDRMLARIPTGGVLSRMSLRSMARRRGRSVALTAQFGAAVGAAVLVACLAASIADFNGAELASFRWDHETTAADPVSPFGLDRPDRTGSGNGAGTGAEAAIHTEGMIDDWEIEVFGVAPDTAMIDADVTSGSWLSPSGTPSRRPGDVLPAVLAERFADQEGYEVGDQLTVDLAAGPTQFEVIGLHPIRSVALFAPADALSVELGTPGRGNTLWSTGGPPAPGSVGAAVVNTTRDELFAEDAAARDAILGIFGAIGVIVVSVSLIGTGSTVAMNLFERRRETATLQANGARRRDVRRLLGVELLVVGMTGWTLGSMAGIAGARAIMGFFAASNAIDLGFEVAWTALPLAALAVAGVVHLFAVTAARGAQRKPLESTLRAAT
ncbi:MAG: ABC transporter permease [Microthrixaceae bacterium]|nr:ABC transporter permease [Microthrixaceae bacterium]